MHVTWVQIRLVTILSVLFALPLALVFRAMGRQVREDYRLQRHRRTRDYEKLASNFAYLTVFISVFALVTREIVVGTAFAAFAFAISMTIWLNKPRPS